MKAFSELVGWKGGLQRLASGILYLNHYLRPNPQILWKDEE